MSLVTFQEVRPWVRSIKHRTSIRDRMGAMPPFFVEKDIGILEFKDDPSLSDEELATIQAWRTTGLPGATQPTCPRRLNSHDPGSGRSESRTWCCNREK